MADFLVSRMEFLFGHICPEAAKGGPIAAVEEGDFIVINPAQRTLQLEVPANEIKGRLKKWQKPELETKVPVGSVRHKYARLVSSARYGCVL